MGLKSVVLRESKSFYGDNFTPESTLNMICSVTHYPELHNPMSFFIINSNFYQVKMLMFCTVQTTNSTFIDLEKIEMLIQQL